MHYLDPPHGWGNDELGKFIDFARGNTFATFENLKEDYKKLSEIDTAFEIAVGNLNFTPFAALFVFQAHSAFRGALSLALNAQVTETHACLRLVLEDALYGFYFFKNPASLTTWLNRHENEESKKRVMSEFKIRGEHKSLLATLKTSDKKLGDDVAALYEHTIDFGAHPNKLGLKQRSTVTNTEGNAKFDVHYLIPGNDPASRLAFRRAAQIGVSALTVFGLAHKERFDLIGLTDKIHNLRKGL
jgi:hypothetical protein